MAESMLTQLAGTGVVGAFLVIALLALRQKDGDLRAESKARIEDSQRMLELALRLQKDVTTAVAALTEIVEKWEKREEDRERLTREVALRTQGTPLQEIPPPLPRAMPPGKR